MKLPLLEIEGLSRKNTLKLIDILIAKGVIKKSKREILDMLDKNTEKPKDDTL